MFTYKGTLDALVGAATVLTLVEFTALTLVSSVRAVGLAVTQSLQLDAAVRHSRALPLRRVAPVAIIICYYLCHNTILCGCSTSKITGVNQNIVLHLHQNSLQKEMG